MSTLRDQLTAIYDEHGTLDAALVVDTARNPKHPLHNRFEWDDAVASEKWRLEQAGQLLRVVKLDSDPDSPRNLRAFLAVKGKDTHRSEYIPTQVALADEFTRRLVLAEMEREWKALKRRYEHMTEFAQLVICDLMVEAS